MESNYVRLTANERVKIEEMINEGVALQEIADTLNKNTTSISREVSRNRIKLRLVSKSKFMRNPCEKRSTCQKKHLCKRTRCNKICSKCEFIFCHEKCDEFVLWHCERLSRWPHVCNRCKWYSTCPEQRYAYHGLRAQRIAASRASLARKYLAIDAVEVERIDTLISPLLKRGQAPYHIWNNHRDELGFCLATFYAYINAGIFSQGRMGLVRAVKFKARKEHRETKDKRNFTGRTYADYLVWMEAYHDENL